MQEEWYLHWRRDPIGKPITDVGLFDKVQHREETPEQGGMNLPLR